MFFFPHPEKGAIFFVGGRGSPPGFWLALCSMDEDKKKGSAEEERRLHCMSFSVSLGFSFLSIAMAVVKDASFLPWSHSRHVLDINTRRIKLEKFLMIAFVVSLK